MPLIRTQPDKLSADLGTALHFLAPIMQNLQNLPASSQTGQATGNFPGVLCGGLIRQAGVQIYKGI